MLESELDWLAGLIMLAIIFSVVAWKARPSLAVGVAVALSFAFPVWLQLTLFSVPTGTIVGSGADIKVSIATFGLCLYCFLPRATFPLRLVACDFAVIALIAIHILSDTKASGFSLGTLMRCYGEWYVPYVAGRLAIQSLRDIYCLWPVVAAVSIFLGLCAMFEAISGLNPYESVFGLRPHELTPRDAIRWGIRRAYGPCLNPIYFGVLQLLLLGWGVFAARLAIRRIANRMWLLAPIPAVFGIICTGSRGPILGLVVFFIAVTFLHYRRARLAFVIAGCFAGLLVISQRERVLDSMEQWSGESVRMQNKQVVVDDDTTKFTGTRSRLLTLRVYGIAFKRSGLFGFGTAATAGFPVQVPVGAQEVETLKRVRYVDNSYALLLLRFGYAGLIAFLCVCGSALWQCLRCVDLYRDEDPSLFAMFVCASLISTNVVMLTVWMPHDFGYPLLWMSGIASGLIVADRSGALERD